MLATIGSRFSAFFHRFMPDPFVLAVLLTLLTFGAALLHAGDPVSVLDAWVEGKGSGTGFWNLLAFGMQMCLILVTGHALAESPPLAKLLDRVASQAKTPARAVVIVAWTAMVLGLLNWGLGLIAGALLARKVGQRARANGIPIHYPLVVAAGYTGLLVWHGGLSGSAPLKATRAADLIEVLGPELGNRIGSISLELTIGSPSNLLVNLVLLAVVPWVLLRLLPANPADRSLPPEVKSEPAVSAGPVERPAERLERSRILMLLIVIPGLAALALLIARQGLGRLNLNVINFAFLFVGLLLHGSLVSYGRAIGEATRGCAGIILQFPFYAGIMGVLGGTGLLELVAGLVAESGAALLPAVGFYMAGVVNLFVPSGGGQWAVQGPILLEAGLQAGVEPSRMLMALAYGDQWTNMLQPFWALPLLAITGAKARDIIGYTAVLLVISQLVFLAGLYL